jgi:hypothetical protein
MSDLLSSAEKNERGIPKAPFIVRITHPHLLLETRD